MTQTLDAPMRMLHMGKIHDPLHTIGNKCNNKLHAKFPTPIETVELLSFNTPTWVRGRAPMQGRALLPLSSTRMRSLRVVACAFHVRKAVWAMGFVRVTHHNIKVQETRRTLTFFFLKESLLVHEVFTMMWGEFLVDPCELLYTTLV